MHSIDLKTAVARIYQIVDQRRSREAPLPSPFFFITGAGVSHPPIPLAKEMEEQCRQVAKSYDDSIPPVLKTSMDSYSYWMKKAYPSSEELQTYLRGLMENKPISKANLRLAHLLLNDRLARTVFTTNFDDMLQKALELFGEHPLVCDHPQTVGRIRIESKDIQIVHVHGSYWFYDCCNSKHDISERSQSGGPVSVLLDQSLRDHSPIIVGYSGWEGDIIMSALQRRLSSSNLGVPVFWFCYKRESPDTLPDWLTKSDDVFFVLPDALTPAAVASSDSQPSEPKGQAFSLSSSKAEIGDSSVEAKAPVLSANRVFDALVHKFHLPAPPLTENPLAFYADHLKSLLGTSDLEDEQDTYYGFNKVIARVERAKDSETNEELDLLQKFRDAMSKANYRGAIKSASGIDLTRLAPKQKTELVFALMDASLGLNDNSNDEIEGYDLLIRTVDLLDSAGSVDSRLQEQVAKALVNKGVMLGTFGKNEEELAVYDDVMRRFADAEEPALQKRVAMALVNKGVALGTLSKNEEAIAVYDDVMRRFADAEEPALQKRVAMALVNKGVTLGTLGKNEEAIAVYHDVASRFADAKEPDLQEQVAKALVNEGVTLGTLGKSEKEIAAYDDVVRRFADAKEPALQGPVARALINKGVTLGTLGKSEEAIAVYDDVVHRFANAKEPALQELVARALINKGVTLGTLGKNEEAIAAYHDVASRFADAREPILQEQVARALFNKALTLGTLGKSEEAIAVYDDVVRCFANAKEPVLREPVARALVNKGVTLGTLGKSEEEIAVYDDVASRFADAREPILQEQVAKAILNKGITCELLGRKENAYTCYRKVLARFAGDSEPAIASVVSQAKKRLDDLQNGSAPPNSQKTPDE